MTFTSSVFLWLLPVWFAGLLIFRPRRAGARLRSGSLLRFVVTALAFLCLIFAASGLSFQRTVRKTQVVVAADVSDSIFQLDDQSARIRELLAALDPETTDAALVVFARGQALERPMAPLPPAFDLSHRAAVIDTRATDLAAALGFARTAFDSERGARAVLLLSDFRDTRNAPIELAGAAATLGATGISLLATPAVLGPSSDVRLAELRVPDSASIARAVAIDITVAAQKPVEVKVRLARAAPGHATVFIDSQILKLAPEKEGSSAELRQTVRLIDHPPHPGVAVYTATVSGPEGALPGDVLINNSLSAAVRVDAPSKWAVLARANSTLAQLANDPAKPLGADISIFAPDKFPIDASAYNPFSGVLLDGLSAAELPEGGPALRALEAAVQSGKALVAIGGAAAFGAGGHPRGGVFESLLPIELTPEDTRVRSVLFLLDISRSMNEGFSPRGGTRVRKLDHAAGQLQAVQKLRPKDRLGLIEFSGTAQLTVPLSNEPLRAAFLDALRAIQLEYSTDLASSLALAKTVLDADNAEEQLVIMISDGIQTVSKPPQEIIEAAKVLCPLKPDKSRRTTLSTFGIGVEQGDANSTGEQLLKDLAAAGGGRYSADFVNLGDQLSKTFEESKKDFYVYREPFQTQLSPEGAALIPPGAWPELKFHNRVKAKPGADTLLLSQPKKGRAEPLLVVSGPGDELLARRAALTLSLDGPEGAALLAPGSAGRALPATLLSWAEARPENSPRGIALLAEPASDGSVEIELRAFDPASGEPLSGLRPQALLTMLKGDENPTAHEHAEFVPLKAAAPGIYRALVDAPPASVCRLTVRDGARTLAERFVSTPCAAELRQFGVDRGAMSELVARAGPAAGVIESPRDLANWAAAKKNALGLYDLRPWLLILALVLFLARWSWSSRSTG